MRKRFAVTGGNTSERSSIVRRTQHGHAVIHLAVAAVDHRKRLDLALAARFGDELRHLAAMTVGLGLNAAVLRERLLRRLPRHYQRMMFGDEPTLAIKQAEFSAAAQPAHHRAGRMRHVGAERRAEKR